jgi:hypothetical protein
MTTKPVHRPACGTVPLVGSARHLPLPAEDNTTAPDFFITPTHNGADVAIDSVQVNIRRFLAVGGKLFARLNVVKAP